MIDEEQELKTSLPVAFVAKSLSFLSRELLRINLQIEAFALIDLRLFHEPGAHSHLKPPWLCFHIYSTYRICLRPCLFSVFTAKLSKCEHAFFCAIALT